MLELFNIGFSYSGRQVLRDISLKAEDGCCTVLTGDNGSGKSTLLSVAAGILKPDSGSVKTTGRTGYLPQQYALLEDMSVCDNIRFFSRLCGVKPPKELPFSVGEFLKIKVSSLSGGMKKRVSLACALLGEPQNLLLDEPAASLDAEFQEELKKTVLRLRADGCCIVYISHDAEEYSLFCDRRLHLSDGILQPVASVPKT